MSVNPNFDNQTDKLYPALYEVSTIYSDLAKTVLNSFSKNEYHDPEAARRIGLGSIDVAEQALKKIEPAFVPIQWARRRLDPEGWQQKTHEILYKKRLTMLPPLEKEGSFWTEMPETPRKPRGTMNNRLILTLEKFKGRVVSYEDIGKVLYAEEYDYIPDYVKSKASSLVHQAINYYIPDRLKEAKIGLEKVRVASKSKAAEEVGFVIYDLDSPPDFQQIDLVETRVSDEELLEWAIALRNEELRMQKTLVPDEIETIWSKLEESQQKRKGVRERKAERWFKHKERMEDALEYSIEADAEEEIANWKADEELWFEHEQELIRIARIGPLSSQLEPIPESFLPPPSLSANEVKSRRRFRGELDEDGYPVGFIEEIEALEEKLKNPPSHREIAEYMKTRGWERDEYLTES